MQSSSKNGFLPALMLACMLIYTSVPTSALAKEQLPALFSPFLSQIKAGTIAVVSDGDFLASSYATGRVTPQELGHKDILTLISLRNGAVTTSALEVSNSVTSPPEVLSLASDGNTAYVIERLGQRTPSTEYSRDLPPGRRLFRIDLSDPAQPRITDTAEVAAFPESVRVSPDGRFVAVMSNTPQASLLQIVPVADGRFGAVATFDLADHQVPATADSARGGRTATAVEWHPSGRYLAVNMHTQNRVAFFEFSTTADGKPAVRRWGNLVDTGPDPFTGRFTADGGYYLTADWGRNFSATNLEGRLPTQPSSLSVIRLADRSTSGQQAQHRRVHTAQTDRSSEGIAVSPDGLWVATVNMRETALPRTSSRFTKEASVSLLRFDPANGTLRKIGNYPFDGVLPEGAAFDLAGEHLLVSVYEYHDGNPPGAGLEVWKVRHDQQPGLERVGRIPMPHGAHHVEVGR